MSFLRGLAADAYEEFKSTTDGTGGTSEEDWTLLMLIAGSICKDFSSMGDGARLVGKHVSLMQ